MAYYSLVTLSALNGKLDISGHILPEIYDGFAVGGR